MSEDFFFSCKVKLYPAAPAVFISHLNVYYFTELGKQLLSVACIILKKELLLSLIAKGPELSRRAETMTVLFHIEFPGSKRVFGTLSVLIMYLRE